MTTTRSLWTAVLGLFMALTLVAASCGGGGSDGGGGAPTPTASQGVEAELHALIDGDSYGTPPASSPDPAYIRQAAQRGVFAYIIDTRLEELEGTIDITLRRFAEYHNLQGAFGRRALIEQAKGILMARHAIDEHRAFDMLRAHSQRNGRKLADVAEAVVESHLLLLPPLGAQTDRRIRGRL